MSELSNKLNGYSGNDELRTPRYLWNWLHRRFNFNTDAASNSENSKCGIMFGPCRKEELADVATRSDFPQSSLYQCICGLCSPWANHRVFVNPPYSRPLMGQFIKKAISERDSADIIVMLVKCDTSTENYRKLAANAHIEFLHRVRHEDENGKLLPAATFASCIAILRPTEPRA